MSFNSFYLLLVLAITPSLAIADNGWVKMAYLSIMIPISVLPYYMGRNRIIHEEKKYSLTIKGSTIIYTLLSLATFIIAVIFIFEIGIVHYFVLVITGPLIGFLIFKTRLDSHLKENGKNT